MLGIVKFLPSLLPCASSPYSRSPGSDGSLSPHLHLEIMVWTINKIIYNSPAIPPGQDLSLQDHHKKRQIPLPPDLTLLNTFFYYPTLLNIDWSAYSKQWFYLTKGCPTSQSSRSPAVVFRARFKYIVIVLVKFGLQTHKLDYLDNTVIFRQLHPWS